MPLIALSLRRMENGATLAWAVALGFALHLGFGRWVDAARPWYLGLFAFGAVAAREAVAGRVPGWWRSAGYALGLVALGTIFVGCHKRFDHYILYFDNSARLATALLLAAPP